MDVENSILDNVEVHETFAVISVNPRMYPLSVIYMAAYSQLDKVHVMVDGDPDTEILLEIRPKEDAGEVDLKQVGYEFNNKLIHYSVYTINATKNISLREKIMKKALENNIGQQ